MKKKVFSITFGLMFICSLFSTASSDILEVYEDEYDCYDRVEIMVIQADNAGWTIEELAWLTNAAYAVYCYGYTWEDVYNADQ